MWYVCTRFRLSCAISDLSSIYGIYLLSFAIAFFLYCVCFPLVKTNQRITMAVGIMR